MHLQISQQIIYFHHSRNNVIHEFGVQNMLNVSQAVLQSNNCLSLHKEKCPYFLIDFKNQKIITSSLKATTEFSKLLLFACHSVLLSTVLVFFS